MFRYGLGSTFAILLSAILVADGHGQQRPPSAASGSTKAGKSESDPKSGLLPLPKNALILITENLEKAQAMLPDFILMSPKRFAEMQQRLRELEAKLQAKTQPVYKVELRGRVTGETVHLSARYHILVSAAGERIGLGGLGAQILSARLGDDVPIIAATKEGFVWIPDPGDQPAKSPAKVILDIEFEVPVTNQVGVKDGESTSYRFAFGMPRSAISTLELTLPVNADSVICNGQVRRPVRRGKQSHVGPIGLGSPKRLDVSWTSKRPRAVARRKDDIRWRFTLKILEHQYQLHGELIGRLPSGKQKTWTVRVPPSASVMLPESHKDSYEVSRDGESGVWRVTPKPDRLADREVTLLVDAKGQWSDGDRFAIPQIQIAGSQAKATIDVVVDRKVSGAYAWRYFPQPGWNRAETAGTKTTDARFEGWIPAYDSKALGEKLPPLLEVYFEPVRPVADSHIRHQVRLREVENRFVWLNETSIEVKPIHGRVRYIEVSIPDIDLLRKHLKLWAACGGLALGPGSIVGSFPPGAIREWSGTSSHPVFQRWSSGSNISIQTERLPNGRTRIYVDAGEPEFGLAQPFSLMYAATYHVDASCRDTWIPLIQVHTPRKTGEDITVSVEDADWELTQPSSESGVRKVRLSLNRRSPFLALAWQPSVARLAFSVTSDVTLEPHRGYVRERWKCKSAHKDMRRGHLPVPLRVPADVENLLVQRNGRTLSITATNKPMTVPLAPGDEITLTYAFSYRQDGANHSDGRINHHRVRIPFVRPATYSDLQHRVHVWAPLGVLPQLVRNARENESWRDLGTIPVAGTDRLPAWAGETNVAAQQLLLAIPSRLAAVHEVLVDRALLQVLCYADGTEFWCVRYVLSSLRPDELRIGFPIPVDELHPAIRINGKLASWQAAASRDTVIVRLPTDVPDDGTLLEIRYTMRSAQAAAVDLRFLTPPTVNGQLRTINGVRWQIITPTGSLPWIDGDYRPWPRKWIRRGWLFEKAAAVDNHENATWIGSDPEQRLTGGVVLTSGTLQPLRMLILPREAWLLVGSGFFILLGFLVVIPTRIRFIARGLVLLGILPAVIAAVVLRPLWIDVALYAIQPGVAVFVLTMVAHWLIRRHVRRRLEHLPSFAPLQPTSSVVQTAKPRRSPSTVDADRQVIESAQSSLESGASGA